MSDYHLPDIARDILEQRCVLLLGPDLIRCGGMPVNQALGAHLLSQHGRHVQHAFEREWLFKFMDEKSKRRIQTEAIPEFFRDVVPDSDTLLKLLSIPFHLVLQVSPDTFLSDCAHRHSVMHQFKYFCGGGKPVDAVELPATANPLFYNLCGTKDRFDSMVLDFDDLYDYFNSVFNQPGLPQNLRTALEQCNTFLFLGFQLDKWYSQLLIRWISDVTGAERFSNKYNFGEKGQDLETFVREHLQVFSAEKEHTELLSELYTHFEKLGKLRALANPVSPSTVAVRRLVQNGELEKALLMFHELSDSIGEKNASTMLLSQFNDLKTASSNYALTKEQFWDKSQNLKFRLLETMDKHAYAL
ncbi:MAG: SIR2 family protein [Saprospiraceae bacterium]